MIGLDVVRQLGIFDVLFIYGVAGMIVGSLNAVRAKQGRMMIAYSSVAQIGYIFAGIGLGTQMRPICAMWHMMAHALTKSMLFIANSALREASGGSNLRKDLRGVFYRSPLAAAAFTLGGVNLVGVPLLSVFVTKLTLAQAAIEVGGRHMIIVLSAMVISTVLNALYFLGTSASFFSPREGVREERVKPGRLVTISLAGFIAANLVFGILSGNVIALLADGLIKFV